MKAMIAYLIGALFALRLNATGGEIKPTNLKVAEIHPTSIRGKSGARIGTLNSITGFVKNVKSHSFEVSSNGVDGATVFVCKIHPQPNEPKAPKVGDKVRLAGFEELVLVGFDSTVSQYLMIRKEVLEATGLPKSDPFGGQGKFEFDTLFWVVEVNYVDEPTRGGRSTSDDMRSKFDLKLREILTPVVK